MRLEIRTQVAFFKSSVLSDRELNPVYRLENGAICTLYHWPAPFISILSVGIPHNLQVLPIKD